MIYSVNTYLQQSLGASNSIPAHFKSRNNNAMHLIQFENFNILELLHDELQIVYANLRV